MMAFDKLEVVLTPHQRVYFPGQTLQGFVRVVISNDTECRRITVQMTGLAVVHWVERQSKYFEFYSSDERYMDLTQELWNGEGTGNRILPGIYSFPFSFEIPANIPSSFISNTGRVIYEVRADAQRPIINRIAITKFSVNCSYDLNLDPIAARLLYKDKDKNVCCLWCTSGPIHLELSASRTGYVPGENILLNGVVLNNTRFTIRYSETKIIQKVVYFAKSDTCSEQRTVQRLYRPSIRPGGKDEWSDVPLVIPPIPPSRLNHCSIIDIDYFIELSAKVGACKIARIEVPIVIGSIPLRNTPPHIRDETSPFIPNSQWPESRAPPYTDNPPPYPSDFLPQKDYFDVPPPSYAACMFAENPTKLQANSGTACDTDPPSTSVESDVEG